MPNTIMHFEIPADDLERATSFYREVFGWKIEPYPMPPGADAYYGVMAKSGEEGINGGMLQRKMPGHQFTNYVTVDSIDDSLATVLANGGQVALPKQEIGQDMGWIAVFIDPESNLIGLHQAPAMAPQKPARRSAAKTRRPAAKTRRPAAKKAARKTAKSAPKKSARGRRGAKKRR